MRRILSILPILALACGGSSDSPSGPDPGSGTVEIAVVWDGHVVQWGAPDTLRANVSGAPAGARIVWRSLEDFYLGQPAVFGRGAATTAAPLRPGITSIEALVMVGDSILASDGAEVEVAYRESWNVALESHVPYPNGTVGDVWVTDGHALVARRGAGGISILSMDGAAREVGRFTAPGLFTQDVKASGGLAFVSNESADHPSSVVILDLADPAGPRVVGGVPRSQTPTAHNLWVEGDRLYIASVSGSDLIHIYDIGDPAAPEPLGTLASTNGSAHDMHVREGIVYGSYLALGEGEIGEVVIGSVDPLARLSTTTYPGAFTHSSWLSADGRYLYVADEIVNAPIRIFDVANPAAPELVNVYQPRLGTVPHNFQVRDGQTAFLADYKHGAGVIDVSDPVNPRLIGFYDTFAGIQADGTAAPESRLLSTAHESHEKGQGLFNGAWGVHWTDDGRFVASDMASGLYVLRFTGP